MPKLRKIICSTLLAILTALSFKASAKVITTPENKLTVYAGPQSVVPLEIISVTVEAVNAQGGSLDNYPVTLSYNADDVAIMISGKTINGLVSFDVPAQTRAGLMTFTAYHKEAVSHMARIVVTAKHPLEFTLNTKQSRQVGAVDVSSNLIADMFGNQLSDLSLAVMEWIDGRGLLASQTTQLSNGRIIFTASCPKRFSGPLHIHASLKNISVVSEDISALCNSERG